MRIELQVTQSAGMPGSVYPRLGVAPRSTKGFIKRDRGLMKCQTKGYSKIVIKNEDMIWQFHGVVQYRKSRFFALRIL